MRRRWPGVGTRAQPWETSRARAGPLTGGTRMKMTQTVGGNGAAGPSSSLPIVQFAITVSRSPFGRRTRSASLNLDAATTHKGLLRLAQVLPDGGHVVQGGADLWMVGAVRGLGDGERSFG
jgi:hypothetical protein